MIPKNLEWAVLLSQLIEEDKKCALLGIPHTPVVPEATVKVFLRDFSFQLEEKKP